MFPFFNDGVDGIEPLECRLLGTSVLENSRGWNQVNLYDMHAIKDFPASVCNIVVVKDFIIVPIL